MNKRLLVRGLVSAVLMFVSWVSMEWSRDSGLLESYAAQISAEATEVGGEGRKVLERVAQNWESGVEANAGGRFTVVVYRNDSLLGYSDAGLLPPLSRLRRIGSEGTWFVEHFPAGWIKGCTIKATGGAFATLLIPVRYTRGNFDRQAFAVSADIPSTVHITRRTTPYPLDLGVGVPLFLEGHQAKPGGWWFWYGLLAGSWGFFMLLRLIVGLSGLVAGLSVAGIFLGNIFWNFPFLPFEGFPFFEPVFSGNVFTGRSVADFLLRVSLTGVWVHLAMRERYFEGLKRGFVPLVGGVALTAVCIWFCILVARMMVDQDAFPFRINEIVRFDLRSWLSVAGLFSFFVVVFFLNHQVLKHSIPTRLSWQKKLAVAGVAVLITLSLTTFSDGILMGIGAGVLVFFYLWLLDTFLQDSPVGFGVSLLWVVYFAIFHTIVLQQANREKSERQLVAYAKALVDARDTKQAEPLLAAALASDALDTAALQSFFKPWPFNAEAGALRTYINSELFAHGYLFEHYVLSVFGFDKDRLPVVSGQRLTYEQIMGGQWEQAVVISEQPAIRFYTDASGRGSYLFKIHTHRVGDVGQPVVLLGSLQHTYSPPKQVFAHTFHAGAYKDLAGLWEYDFAVSVNRTLEVEHGQPNLELLQFPLARGAHKLSTSGGAVGRREVIFRSADGSRLAVVGMVEGGWYRGMTLFSVLFMLGALLFFFMLGLGQLTGRHLGHYPFFAGTDQSLSRRIHTGNLLILGMGFLVIGWLTYLNFSRVTENAERANAIYKSDALHHSMKSMLYNSILRSDSIKRVLVPVMRGMSASLSLDANLFDPRGILVSTTQEYLHEAGLLPPVMPVEALRTLGQGGSTEYTEYTPLRSGGFFTRYLPLRNREQTIYAYLGVPYRIGRTETAREISDFIGLLAGIYVFLLLIAFVVTLFLTRSIVQPILLISNKIKTLGLGDKNEPLEYKGNSEDELGLLVARYNEMVGKLEASKSELIRLEREGAWREMARQVAHDIKNPLTTMKLSMQQLERVSSNPEQAAQYLRKAISRLIEQIDSLAQIASEFSMFANLDIREKYEMVLNDVVENVHNLFSEQAHVQLSLHLPEEKCRILGDKNHLIRVFNNLVINAIQSIPSDRQGRVQVHLYTVGRSAVIQISDNGGGIPEEIQQRVFEPNFTTKTSGSGLGLAICRKIVEAHDGNIRFDTRENVGTDFFVEIPLQ